MILAGWSCLREFKESNQGTQSWSLCGACGVGGTRYLAQKWNPTQLAKSHWPASDHGSVNCLRDAWDRPRMVHADAQGDFDFERVQPGLEQVSIPCPRGLGKSKPGWWEIEWLMG